MRHALLGVLLLGYTALGTNGLITDNQYENTDNYLFLYLAFNQNQKSSFILFLML
jgi:hypothetical protein